MTGADAGAGEPGEVLRLVDVHRSYRTGPIDLVVLQGVDLLVRAGDFAAVMGPSGSGKSTLMNILGLLDRPSRGHYLLKGNDVGSLADDELARLRNASIGFVFQSFHLLERSSAWQNVALPLVYRGVAAPERRQRAFHALEQVGLAGRTEHRPAELSGGQRQRVAIARALVGTPEIVLADEPTGALDLDSGQEIMRLLAELNAERGVTIVVITHDHAVAAQCRRRLRIDGGRLREQALATGARG